MTASESRTAPEIVVVSDVVCPWCLIGKRRLEKGLALLGRDDIRVHWKPFELNPNAPAEGWDREAYRARKFGSREYAKQLERNVAQAGAADGIDFQFDRIYRVPNTFNAHRLIWLAGRDGVQDAVVENLFAAYFLRGENVGDSDVLVRAASESGLSAATIDEFRNGAGTAEVRAELTEAQAHGISGVPAFFVDARQVLSGAQKPELMAAVLEPLVGTAATQCFIDGGGCA